MIFSRNDQTRIAEAVKEAEGRTSGEIVPVILPSSADYSYIAHRTGLGFLVLFSGFTYWLHLSQPFWDLVIILSLQALGWGSGWLLGQQPFFIRLWLGRRKLAENVDDACLESFARNGLHNTRDRTGVLILVSLLEHRVEILADKGIHEKLGEGYWKAEVAKLSRAIREGKAADGFVEVIRDVGGKLQDHFPRKSDDTNELDDSIRFR